MRLLPDVTAINELSSIEIVPSRELSVKDAAEILGLSIAQTRRLAQYGAITARKPGGEWYLLRSSVEKYARTPHPTGPKPGSRRVPRKEGSRNGSAHAYLGATFASG